VPVQG